MLSPVSQAIHSATEQLALGALKIAGTPSEDASNLALLIRLGSMNMCEGSHMAIRPSQRMVQVAKEKRIVQLAKVTPRRVRKKKARDCITFWAKTRKAWGRPQASPSLQIRSDGSEYETHA